MLYIPGPETHQAVIDTVNAVFMYADAHCWQDLQTCFADSFVLDDPSLNEGELVQLTSQELVDLWKSFLPGFQATHQQIGNHRVRMNGVEAAVFCYSTAAYYLPNETGHNVWTVFGTYDFRLQFEGEYWKISRMTFRLKFQDGNLRLPLLARQTVQESV